MLNLLNLAFCVLYLMYLSAHILLFILSFLVLCRNY
jgi:hypothetical protein